MSATVLSQDAINLLMTAATDSPHRAEVIIRQNAGLLAALKGHPEMVVGLILEGRWSDLQLVIDSAVRAGSSNADQVEQF